MGASNTKELYMIFDMTDNSKLTLRIVDPADGLLQDTVDAAAASFIANNVFKRNGATATEFAESYIKTVTITDLPEE